MRSVTGFDGEILWSVGLDSTTFALVTETGTFIYDLAKSTEISQSKVSVTDEFLCDSLTFDSKRKDLYLHSDDGIVRKVNVDGKCVVNSDASNVYIDSDCESLLYLIASDSLLILDNIGLWNYDLQKDEGSLVYKVPYNLF